MPEKRYARRDPNEIVDIEHRDRFEDYVEPASGTITVAHIVYGLHSISILMGLLSAGLSIAGAFVFSGPSILAVIINYIFRSDARGTFVDSHFSVSSPLVPPRFDAMTENGNSSSGVSHEQILHLASGIQRLP